VVMILSTQLQARKLSRSVFLMEMICYYLLHVFFLFFQSGWTLHKWELCGLPFDRLCLTMNMGIVHPSIEQNGSLDLFNLLNVDALPIFFLGNYMPSLLICSRA
jgi:hypothetical protein